jgi:hypothetical protein
MPNRTQRRLAPLVLLLAATAPAHAAVKCTVVDGIIAEVAAGAFAEVTETVTLKSTWTADFRWNNEDREAIGWMRISDETGQVVGWVPAGHEGVKCGENN